MNEFKSSQDKEKNDHICGIKCLSILFLIATCVAFVLLCNPNAIRSKLNKMNGFISDGMSRVV